MTDKPQRDAMTLGCRIRDEREYFGFSQAHLARAAMLTEADLVAYENDVREPREGELTRLARALALSVDRLLGEPLRDDPEIAKQLKSTNLSHDDRYEVHRFAEFLKHAGPAPAIPKKEKEN